MKIGLHTWGSEGDIRPFTSLATGLKLAGHDVTLVVTDNAGRDYSEMAKVPMATVNIVHNCIP